MLSFTLEFDDIDLKGRMGPKILYPLLSYYVLQVNLPIWYFPKCLDTSFGYFILLYLPETYHAISSG